MDREPALIDTDILSAIMRRDAAATAQARRYLSVYPQFTISIITRYEILRGLNAKNATTQIARFDTMCKAMEVLELTDATTVRAAKIYGDLHQRGLIIGDADILIAATALEQGRVLVTNNTNHYNRIAGLKLENWLTPA